MSTTILRDNEVFSVETNKSYPIIAKGFRGEPAKLDAIKYEKNFVTVLGKSRKTQMRLKVKYVYQYDEETYQKLRDAFDSNDTEALEREWQKAKPITLT